MVAMGYKEIEVGYPSASQTDYDFVRLIAETGIAPDDVTIVVFTPARRDLIERTVASIRGIAGPVVIHLYTATAPTWRDTVLGHGREDLKRLILAGGRDVLDCAGDLPNVRFQFSPEVFTLTEPDYVLDVCDAMTELWDAAPERPVTLNLHGGDRRRREPPSIRRKRRRHGPGSRRLRRIDGRAGQVRGA
jgi:2-isopropylmalate synthase